MTRRCGSGGARARPAPRAASRRVSRERDRRVRARSCRAADRRAVRPRAAIRRRGRGHLSAGSRISAAGPHLARGAAAPACDSANRSTAGRARPRASGVMMIPIPRRGVFRGVTGLDEAAARSVHRRRADHRKSGSAAACRCRKAPAISASSSRMPTTPAQVEQALRAAHARLEFSIDPELRVLQSAHG